MILMRYMSFSEFKKLIKREPLINEKDHAKAGCHTNSVGFCFFEDFSDEINIAIASVTTTLEYAGGIVSEDVCVIFNVDDMSIFKKCYGIYANPYGSFFDTFTETEYSTTKYDRDLVKPICFVINPSWNEDKNKAYFIDDLTDSDILEMIDRVR